MYTFDANIISDLHKDVYGFRPSAYWWDIWNDSTDDQKQGTWDDLIQALAAENEAQRVREERGLAAFEKDIAGAMEMGAPDRTAAIRWLAGAFEGNYYGARDLAETMCWNYEMPWSMATEIEECLRKAA